MVSGHCGHLGATAVPPVGLVLKPERGSVTTRHLVVVVAIVQEEEVMSLPVAILHALWVSVIISTIILLGFVSLCGKPLLTVSVLKYAHVAECLPFMSAKRFLKYSIPAFHVN